MRARTGNSHSGHRTPHLLSLAAAFGCIVAMHPDSRAHHTTPHDQNPNPPPKIAAVDTTITTFGIGSIIIPLDSCYSTPSFMGNADQDQIVKATYANASAHRGTGANGKVCNTGAGDEGIIAAYSLVQRLVTDGVKVSWAIRAAKTGWHDYDVEITKAGGSPVTWRNRSGSTDTRFSGLTSIRYGGAPFIIDSADAPTALGLIAGYSQSSGSVSYNDVDFHVAATSFTAPIFSTIGQLPKLAVLNATGIAGEQTNKLEGTIIEALMDDQVTTTSWASWVSVAEVTAGKLVTDDFQLLWVPPFSGTDAAMFTKINEFIEQGGHVLFQDESIGVMEGFGSWSGSAYAQTQAPAAAGGFQSAGGLIMGGISSAWDTGDDDETVLSSDYSDPASQFGGTYWTGIGGSKENWKPRYDAAYLDGVRRMVYTEDLSDNTATAPKDRWDTATWRHKDNDFAKGRIYYLGGDNWRKNTQSGLRLLLNTIFVHASAGDTTIEISRSSPIIAPINGVISLVQGTYEFPLPDRTEVTAVSQLADFRFPYTQGHLRVTPLEDITTSAINFKDQDSTYDAKDGIPAANYAGCTRFNSTCRTVFTTTDASTGTRPLTRRLFEASNVATIGPLLTAGLTGFTATEWATLMTRILSGNEVSTGTFAPKLGGVDRSTVAIIPSSLTSGTTRPTMIYFGGTDGMLHAVCGSVQSGVCDTIGRELWAYIPRVLLGDLRRNLAIIDGSPRVSEMFGDFEGTGQNSFRTILTFQTGTGERTANKTPAVYALDITDPASPKVLWEYTMDVAGTDTHKLGKGLIVAQGTTRINNVIRNIAVAQTNNGAALPDASGTPGTGPSASVVTAIDVATGAKIWQHDYSYTDLRVSGNGGVPYQGVPGGAIGLDRTETGALTDIIFGTLYGDLWVLDPATGTSKYGTGPLFRFTTDYHPIGAPPSLYSNGGAPFAVAVTGSYWDRSGSAIWNGDDTQYAFAVSLNTPVASAILTEASTGGNVPIMFTYTGGEKASSQALIVGTELFFTTDTTDINSTGYGASAVNTGKAYGLDLTGNNAGVDTVVAGVGNLANAGTALYSSGGQASEQISFDATSTVGETINGGQLPKATRRLWLRTL